MPLVTQFQTFFLSPFGEPSACEELNRFLRSHRIVNVEKRMVDGEQGTGGTRQKKSLATFSNFN
ncbi:hypothetical protein KJ975_12130 [Myxococcota bacterium]|nr:hypothetical protein [Myxococcota bacterium]